MEDKLPAWQSCSRSGNMSYLIVCFNWLTDFDFSSNLYKAQTQVTLVLVLAPVCFNISDVIKLILIADAITAILHFHCYLLRYEAGHVFLNKRTYIHK